MKRCPQCEFIYEDDQSLCDMDGALLVLDSRTLPNLHALATVEVPVAAAASKAHWRHRTFPAMAALILATVFSLVYFVSTQRRVPAPPAVSGASIAVPAMELPSPSDANQTAPPPAPETNSAAPQATEAVKEEPKPESNKSSAPSSVKKASSKTTPTIERKPAEETKKDDSKVGSILKKTGRILKKPFKF
jgi:outer membrane biosynthesis protein TonB